MGENMENKDYDCICIACSTPGNSKLGSCECGHNYKDAIYFQGDIRRRHDSYVERPRKAAAPIKKVSPVQRLALVKKDVPKKRSSFVKKEEPVKKIKKTNKDTDNSKPKSGNVDCNNNSTVLKKYTRKRKTKPKPKLNVSYRKNKLIATTNALEKTTDQFTKQLESINRNSYFYKCKSYKPIKDLNDNFQFDFTTFNSYDPYYPNALDDINSKIYQSNVFWKYVESGQ